jgi:hypothetical protein
MLREEVRVRNLKLCLCILMIVLCVPCLGGIVVDGDFSDWRDIQPASKGVLSIVNSGSNGAANQLRTVWFTADAEYLYISALCNGPITPAQWSPTMVAIDSDLNPSTGFPTQPLGADYFVQPLNTFDGSIMIHRRRPQRNTNEWSQWFPPETLPRSFAIGGGADNNRVEMRIPLKSIGFSDPSANAIRFRVVDGASCLDAASGSWAPSFRLGYFSYGKDPRGMENKVNLCVNGDFEQLMTANASPLPQDWEVSMKGGAVVDISRDAASGGNALRLKSGSDGLATANSSPIAAGHGLIKFSYKVISSSVGGRNIAIYAIALNAQGAEIKRVAWNPPAEHVGDGLWHEGELEFGFPGLQVGSILVAPRINEATAKTGEAEWLLDAVEAYAVQTGPKVQVARVWCDKPLGRVGEKARFSAWIENSGDSDASATAELRVTSGMRVSDPVKKIDRLAAGQYERVDWYADLARPGAYSVEVTAAWRGLDGTSAEDLAPTSYKLLVIDRDAKYTRQELCTDEQGYWRILDKPKTLQDGNTAPVKSIKHLTSAEIKHNPYGICTHLPRSKDYEDPFNPAHLIDSDPDTVWSSQQNPSPYPGNPPWVQIDLGQVQTIKQVNLVPYWKNTDFPIGFSIRASMDGKRWSTALQVKAHNFVDNAPKRGDKIVQEFPLPNAVKTRFVRVEFERLPLSGGNYAEVSQGYKARLSGVEAIDEGGTNVVLKSAGASIKASDYFLGWQNTAKTVTESFPRIMELGLKWVRIGQWGDQTEWGAVEREKGKFQMDPATDKAISTLAENGVDMLYGLNYGNGQYDNPGERPCIDVGPIYLEGHPFGYNIGPRTEDGRRAFVRYVDWVVRKYGDRVKWWELWNEENGWYPGHEPELYGKLLYAVSRHVKEIDPHAYVMFGGTAAPAPITTEIALREGAAPYVDAYAFHPYGIDKPEGGMGTMEYYKDKSVGKSREETGWNHLEEIIEGVKQPFAQHGRPNVDVWMNEWGTNVAGLDFTYNPGMGEYACAKYLMRFYLYAGWLNVRTAWWALYNMNMSQDWGIFDQHGYGFRPMSFGLQNVCSVVSDVEPIRRLDYTYEGEAPDPKVIGYKRDGKAETVICLWGAESSTDQVKNYPSKLSFALAGKPGRVEIIDLYWGVSQPARWHYENERVVMETLMVHDYPIAISCRAE